MAAVCMSDLSLISAIMLAEGLPGCEIDQVMLLAQEEPEVGKLVVLWRNNPRFRRGLWRMLRTEVEQHLSIYGRLPSLQWKRGITG